MKTIRLLFEYSSYNIFIYDENGLPVGSYLPEEVRDDPELVSLCDDIAERYDRSCEDEKGDFNHTQIGHPFKSAGEEMDFVREVCYFVKLLKYKLGDKYKFVDEYWEDLAWFYWPEE